MKEITIGNTTLEIYTSIEELDVDRFHHYNRQLLLDAGIGGDADNTAKHIRDIIVANAQGDKEGVERAALTLQQNITLVTTGQNPKSRSFALMVHSINGKRQTATHETALDQMLKNLSRRRLTIGLMRQLLDETKKKLISRLRRYTRRGPTQPHK